MITIAYSTSFTQGITLLLFIHSLKEIHGYEAIPSKMLAEKSGIPFPSVVKTLKSLSATGITTTKEGSGGGNMLAKPIANITLLDIFLAMEQDNPLFKMHTSINCNHPIIDDLKDRVDICIHNAADAMKASLQKVSLENLLAGEFKLASSS